MKVIYDVTALMQKQLSPEGVYTKHLYRVLRGLGIDLSPVYRKVPGLDASVIEKHLGHAAKKFFGLFASKGTIMHGPSGHIISESDKFKKVISVNDLAMFRGGVMPADVASRLQGHLNQQMQQNISAVIVPSYEVHNDFLVRFPKYADKIHVVAPGSDHVFEASSTEASSVIASPYFVYVGELDRRSNALGVIKAFEVVAANHEAPKLLLAGEFGYGGEEVDQAIKTSEYKDRITQVGAQSDGRLKSLFSSAICAVLPSHYEGFSFPAVEAMKMGCPVITSSVGAMKELGEDAALLVKPSEVSEIANAMEKVFQDEKYRLTLVDGGKEKTQAMTWLNSARAISEIYSKI